ncbi:nicotinate (nicotinamide) nucleotide adenylyltransferase [Zeaxanthinibacter enoshimensis]|uniref:Probable nicotinate-nucleotide adenylyltransferase n=1 Tax=Zeaxanthinibacter enoshimensis TaxID=392009 RepID=A0A4R6TQN3_9FLAO|nr:nicotinate (nicotinamide) nucleotide adenylyltransferase [Zeaxanthinibacter enoshimensis]TDQ32607.1 nicotinate-nucleotide adenylyltransferase [Zeaxanthinibacter enoshimensis]
MKKTGLYFGTFNPIHIGHLVIAHYMAEFTDLDEVWFVVTPKSPFKQKKSLLDNNHRYQMVTEAIQEYPKLKASTIEFDLPQPNYTIDTLVHLGEKYGQDHEFSLLMGEDNLKSFHKWKNYEAILEQCELFVYPRVSEGDIPERFKDNPRIHRVDAPIMEISSTFIRKQHQAGKDIRPMLPVAVYKYIDEMNFYR